jgi:hypothetical protein
MRTLERRGDSITIFPSTHHWNKEFWIKNGNAMERK